MVGVFFLLGLVFIEIATQFFGAFSKFFNKAAPTGTVNSLPDAVAGAASGVAIVGSQMDLKDAPNATAVTAFITAQETAEGVVSAAINDAAALVTSFTVDTNVGADVRTGFLRLTSGTLNGESRMVSWTGTTVTVISQTDMPAALKQFSAAPANGVTFKFRPLA